MQNQGSDSVRQSVRDAWRYCKEIPGASSISEGWTTFTKTFEATPAWALVVAVVVGLTLVANAWIVPMLMISGGVLAATYYTVKHAVRTALREHESQRQS